MDLRRVDHDKTLALILRECCAL